MIEKKYILTFDQGTTSSRAILFDRLGASMAIEQKEFTQIFPKPGWVEHDPEEIFQSQLSVAVDVISKIDDVNEIAGIGITNQRETTIVWNTETGESLYNAIVWQDRRTSEYCEKLIEKGWEEKVRAKTGLVIDPYFSSTKIKWILDNVKGARKLADEGKMAFGTVDTWLVWKFTKGQKHITDITNASRTMLFNINTLDWDDEILELMNIPKSILPKVCSSSEIYGNAFFNELDIVIPIAGIAGDQQAALFGQQCIQKGMVKNTYGTGNFIVMNTGDKPVLSENKLLTTIAWKINNKVSYALEGRVFVAGAVVQWLRDGLGIINKASEIEELAKEVEDCGDVYFVPALTGLGAPHWDANARGTIIGITRGTNKSHIARAALEAICYQTYDVMKAMEADSGISISELRVDGGATVNNLLMQYQADVLGINVLRPQVNETTALGAAFFAGLAMGFWENIEEISDIWKIERDFRPTLEKEKIQERIIKWHKAVERSEGWV